MGRLARGRGGRRTLDSRTLDSRTLESRTLRLTPTTPGRSCRLPSGLPTNRALSRSFICPGHV